MCRGENITALKVVHNGFLNIENGNKAQISIPSKRQKVLFCSSLCLFITTHLQSLYSPGVGWQQEAC